MARVVWSAEALRNLERLADRLLEHAPAAVSPALGRLYDASQNLKLFPRLGTFVDGYDTELRQLIVDEYRMFYRVEGQTVDIVAVFHGSMDVEGRLRALLIDE